MGPQRLGRPLLKTNFVRDAGAVDVERILWPCLWNPLHEKRAISPFQEAQGRRLNIFLVEVYAMAMAATGIQTSHSYFAGKDQVKHAYFNTFYLERMGPTEDIISKAKNTLCYFITIVVQIPGEKDTRKAKANRKRSKSGQGSETN